VTKRRGKGGHTDETALAAGTAWVLHPVLPRGREAAAARHEDARLGEAVGLTTAIGLDVTTAEAVRLRAQRPATLFGTGKVEAVSESLDAASDGRPEVVVVDAALSPVQQRNLEKAWRCKVLDRTALILEIFGERARTREGRLQVELAALSYQRSRLVRSWTHLERQRGGFGFVGGPGESQLEADRRQIDTRITRLRRALVEVVRTRELHRDARRRVPYPIVALVGYTNAGKSTLFNRLTGAGVVAEDQLFATLDPTMRAVTLPSGRTIILSDTVGFVSDLPTDLVAAFRATLEEAVAADLLVHVRDVSHSDTEAQREDVRGILVDLGIDPDDDDHLIEALNKIDCLDAAARDRIETSATLHANTVAVSAQDGSGLATLLDKIDRKLGATRQIVYLDLPLAEGAALAWLYQHAEILNRRDSETTAHLKVAVDAADLARFAHRFGDYGHIGPQPSEATPSAA
jgi:GTPase